jgi:ATP-dependent Clp protease protease subunit
VLCRCTGYRKIIDAVAAVPSRLDGQGGIGGSASDIKIQAQQSILLKKQLNELQSLHTGQSIEQIEADADRDRWFTPDQAKDYGFIDQVIKSAGEVAR